MSRTLVYPRLMVLALFVLCSLICLAPSASNAFNVNLERIERARLSRLGKAMVGGSNQGSYTLYPSSRYTLDSIDTDAITGPPEQWYSQRLDHFRPMDGGVNATYTFQQRYFVNDTFWLQGDKKGPVFIYIGGESAMTASRVTRGEIIDFARAHNGLLVALEHRFYGKSVPFNNYETENMVAYLSSQQALADLANFQKYINWKMDIPASTTWVCVGGSYPGALSAWFRIKYPQAVAGSLASSAPVQAKADFYEYDQVVARSAGPKCADVIRSMTTEVERRLRNSTQVLKDFQCPASLTSVEFLYVIADVVAYGVQYGSRKVMCDYFEANPTYNGYVQWALRTFNDTGNPCAAWNIASFTGTKAAENLNMRQWMFQSCNEFGYFQVAPKENPLRSSKITVQWHYQVCDDLFGKQLALRPHINYTNEYYGGDEPKGTQIYFVNGSEDPWQALSVTKELSPWLPSHVINGTAHCGDLATPSKEDPPDLTKTRKEIAEYISAWSAPAGMCGYNDACTDNGVCGPKGVCLCQEGYWGNTCKHEDRVNLPLTVVIPACAGILAVGFAIGCLVGRKRGHKKDHDPLLDHE